MTSAATASSRPSASARSGSRCSARASAPRIEFDGRISPLLDLYPAFHPHAVLRLCLCLRRLPGELALCGLSERGIRASPRNISTCCAPAARKRHKELLAPFGLDASDPAFWRRACRHRRLHRRAGSGWADSASCAWPRTTTRSAAACGAMRASRRRWAGSRRGSRASAISGCSIDRAAPCRRSARRRWAASRGR